MRYPWANTALLLLLVAMLATGLGGLVGGEPAFGWVLWLHGVGGYAIVAALVWKARIIGGVLRRRPALTSTRLAFLLLTGLLLATLLTGYLWTYGGRRAVGDYSLMVVHGALATAVVVPLLWHLLARRAVFRVRAARDRRALLRLAGLGAVGLLARPASEGARAALALPGADRRFTGSYETGSLTGRFPEVAWLADNPAPADTVALAPDGRGRGGPAAHARLRRPEGAGRRRLDRPDRLHWRLVFDAGMGRRAPRPVAGAGRADAGRAQRHGRVDHRL